MIGTVVSSAIFLVLVAYSESASLPVAAAAAGQCVYQNKTYRVGEKTDDPCTPCYCEQNGRMACLQIDCFYIPCVDLAQTGRLLSVLSKRSREAVSIATNNDLCVIGNKTYHAGEAISSNPCRPCRCGGGNAISCMIVDCAMTMCVDPTRKDGQCCQYYPNGRNCKYGDHVIKEGEVYKPDANTQCECSKDLYGINALKAVCIKSA